MCLVNLAVRKNDVVHTLIYTCFCLMAQVVKCFSQTFLTFRHLKEDGQFLGLEALGSDVTEYVELCVRQNGLREAHHLTVARIWCQDVCSYCADVLSQTHHEFLANRVDGRVCHLCELLAEVVEQYLRTVADNSQWRIVTHSGNRFLSCSGHRDDGLVDVLLSEAEGNQLVLEVAHTVLHMPSTLQFL